MAFKVGQKFDVVVLQFLPRSAIEHLSFPFLYSNCRFDIVCFTIQLCCEKYSTCKFGKCMLSISNRNSVSVGSANYQSTPLVGVTNLK